MSEAPRCPTHGLLLVANQTICLQCGAEGAYNEPKHVPGCNCHVCHKWRQGIYDSGRWPRPRLYNGERR